MKISGISISLSSRFGDLFWKNGETKNTGAKKEGKENDPGLLLQGLYGCLWGKRAPV